MTPARIDAGPDALYKTSYIRGVSSLASSVKRMHPISNRDDIVHMLHNPVDAAPDDVTLRRQAQPSDFTSIQSLRERGELIRGRKQLAAQLEECLIPTETTPEQARRLLAAILGKKSLQADTVERVTASFKNLRLNGTPDEQKHVLDAELRTWVEKRKTPKKLEAILRNLLETDMSAFTPEQMYMVLERYMALSASAAFSRFGRRAARAADPELVHEVRAKLDALPRGGPLRQPRTIQERYRQEFDRTPEHFIMTFKLGKSTRHLRFDARDAQAIVFAAMHPVLGNHHLGKFIVQAGQNPAAGGDILVGGLRNPGTDTIGAFVGVKPNGSVVVKVREPGTEELYQDIFRKIGRLAKQWLPQG